MIGVILWQLLQEDWLNELNTDGSAGHDFEDRIVQHIYSTVIKSGGYKTSLPRTTLKLETVSGLQHQIDVVVREKISIYHLIECKFTKSSNIEEMYALNAKLLDYSIGAMKAKQKLSFRGYFVTGLTEVNDNFYQYALAWGITPIVLNGLPPLEFLAHETVNNPDLSRQILKLLEETSGSDIRRVASQSWKAAHLFALWRLFYHRWKQDKNDF